MNIKHDEISDKLVSIVVPVYNVEQYLYQCIDSLISQTYRNIEIILVDDGSCDDSPQICDDYAQKDDRIIVIHQKNGGLSNARNAGIRISKGEYIHFLDSDDYLSINAIEILLKNAIENKSDLCFCDAVSFFDNPSESSAIPDISYIRTHNFGTDSGSRMANKLYDENEFKTSAALLFISKQLLISNDILFYDGILHEDNLFTANVFLKAQNATHVYKGLYHRRIHSNSIMTRKFTAKNFHGYCVCVKELIDLWRNDAPDSYDANFLEKHVIMIASSLNDIYHKFSKIEKAENLKEFKELKKNLLICNYFHQWKFKFYMNNWHLSNVYLTIKNRKKSNL